MGNLAQSLEAVCSSTQAVKVGKLIELYIRQLYQPNQVSHPEWESIWRLAFATHGVPFHTELGIQHLEHFIRSGELYPYTHELLSTLKSQGTKLVLLSNVTGNTDIFQQDLERRELAQYFDRVIWSCEIGYRKPSEQAFQIALNSIGSHAAHTLMVGDNPISDMQGAKSIGLSTLLVADQHKICPHSDHVTLRDNLRETLIKLTNPL